jgi:hypothetical protein
MTTAHSASGERAEIRLGTDGAILTDRAWREFLRTAQALAERWERTGAGPDGPPLPGAAVFVGPGDPVLHLRRAELSEIPAGAADAAGLRPPPLRAGAGVTTAEDDRGRLFSAARAGYIGIGTDGAIRVCPAEIADAERMTLYFPLAPLASGAERLLAALRYAIGVEETPATPPEEAVRRARAALAAGEAAWIPLRRGTPPAPGADGRVTIRAPEQTGPAEQEDGSVDHAELSVFLEIPAGEVVAERVFAVPGTPGSDVFGAPIEPPPVREASFEPGENLVEEPGEDRVVYRAAVTGILTRTPTGAGLSESLLIRGDVGPTTGNVRFSRDILVTGDLLGRYAIECGGALTIRGTVENGARIDCAGDLTVGRGVCGRRTRVTVGGGAEIGYLQDSAIRVGGDLVVREYLIESEATVRGTAAVLGRTTKGNRRGAVMGGALSGFGGLRLHSAGSALTMTRLFAGVDRRLEAALDETKGLLPALLKKMTRLQGGIGFDVAAPDAAERLKRMPEAVRRRVRRELVELRTLATQREELLGRVETLEERAYATDPNALAITIENHLVPNVAMVIGRYRLAVNRPAARSRYVIEDEQIVRAPLG